MLSGSVGAPDPEIVNFEVSAVVKGLRVVSAGIAVAVEPSLIPEETNEDSFVVVDMIAVVLAFPIVSTVAFAVVSPGLVPVGVVVVPEDFGSVACFLVSTVAPDAVISSCAVVSRDLSKRSVPETGAVAVVPDGAVAEMTVVVDFSIGKEVVVVVVFISVDGFFDAVGVVALISAGDLRTVASVAVISSLTVVSRDLRRKLSVPEVDAVAMVPDGCGAELMAVDIGVITALVCVTALPDCDVVEMMVAADFSIGKEIGIVTPVSVGSFFVVVGVAVLVSAEARIWCDAEVMAGDTGVIPVAVSVGFSDVVATLIVALVPVTATVLLVASFSVVVVTFLDVVTSVSAVIAVSVVAISAVVGVILVIAIVVGDVWSRRDVEGMPVELCKWVVVDENIGHKRHCEMGTLLVVEAASFVIFSNFFNVVAFVVVALVLVAAAVVLVYSFPIDVIAVVSTVIAGVSVELLVGVVVIFVVFNDDPALVGVAVDADDV
nr:unnamed protein product [Haemonchus contortus]